MEQAPYWPEAVQGRTPFLIAKSGTVGLPRCPPHCVSNYALAACNLLWSQSQGLQSCGSLSRQLQFCDMSFVYVVIKSHFLRCLFAGCI